MKKYFSFFKTRLINGLQYRAAAIAGIATQYAWGGATLLMYWAFYKNNINVFPMTFKELANYIWLQQGLLTLFAMWFFDMEIFASITSGNIAYELCRPVDIYNMWYTKNMAARLARVALRCLPLFIVAVILPYPFNLTLPPTVFAGAMFFLSLILGFLVVISFLMLIYISSFYTISSTGVRLLSMSVVELLSGAILPLPFFPPMLQKIVNLLPFASMQNTPFLIYAGHIIGTDALFAVVLQIAWLVILVLIGKVLIQKALKRVIVQGG